MMRPDKLRMGYITFTGRVNGILFNLMRATILEYYSKAARFYVRLETYGESG